MFKPIFSHFSGIIRFVSLHLGSTRRKIAGLSHGRRAALFFALALGLGWIARTFSETQIRTELQLSQNPSPDQVASLLTRTGLKFPRESLRRKNLPDLTRISPSERKFTHVWCSQDREQVLIGVPDQDTWIGLVSSDSKSQPSWEYLAQGWMGVQKWLALETPAKPPRVARGTRDPKEIVY